MSTSNLEEIKKKISIQHEGDEKQLKVIFSDSPRLIVEAPAGYGKTTTMISRIAYLYAAGRIPNPKRMLGLTFSVNAALKIKREVAEKLPLLLCSQNSPVSLSNKVTVTNYHGFCKGILKKYGFLLSDSLRKDINLFKAISDSEINKNVDLKSALTNLELEQLLTVDNTIKHAQVPDLEAIIIYNKIVINKLLPIEYVTHNAVIMFVLEIFESFIQVRKFYQGYYPLIVVDEFQDTNCIAWRLLEALISDCTQLVFLGDPLQRIYGFIGALPDIMTTAAGKYCMVEVALLNNYRFKNNLEMLKLDKNIRENAASNFSPTIQEADIANLPAFWGSTQEDEANQVIKNLKKFMIGGTNKIAILFKSRGKNAEVFETELLHNFVQYFYGMFTDDDPEYINFHIKCQELFINKFGKSKNINKKALITFSTNVKKMYASTKGKIIDSLLQLLDALVEKVSIDYANLVSEDRYTLLLDIFENRQLKQAMEYVDSQVVLSTVHGAKGLEWDYVFLTDIERWIFPGSFICNTCPNKFTKAVKCKCQLPNLIPDNFKETILDELSVFYVGITRARKQVFISASSSRYNANEEKKQSCFSCFTSINGVRLVNAESFSVQ